MWINPSNARGTIAGRHDDALEADAMLRGDIRHDAVDPVGFVPPDYIKACAEGVNPFKTVSKFLTSDADEANYEFGMTAFGKMASRYGEGKTDRILLFKQGHFGKDGPCLLDSEFKRRVQQRARDRDFCTSLNVLTAGIQPGVKEELMSMLLCDYRYANMEMTKVEEGWEKHDAWKENGFFPRYSAWGPAHALSRSMVRFVRHSKDAQDVKDTTYKEPAGNGWYALEDLVGELMWNEQRHGRPVPYMTAFSFLYMIIANAKSRYQICFVFDKNYKDATATIPGDNATNRGWPILSQNGVTILVRVAAGGSHGRSASISGATEITKENYNAESQKWFQKFGKTFDEILAAHGTDVAHA